MCWQGGPQAQPHHFGVLHPCCCGRRASQITLVPPSGGCLCAKPRLCWGKPGSSPTVSLPHAVCSHLGKCPHCSREIPVKSKPVVMCSRLRSLLPVFGGSLGARETIPEKEQSDGKLIPNGAISPLRSKVCLVPGGWDRGTQCYFRGISFLKVYYFPPDTSS